MTEIRKSTALSGIGILLIVLGLIALAVYVAFNPWILVSLAYILLVLVIVVVLVAIAVFLAMGLLAVPFYIKEGVTQQTDRSYNLDDIKPVKEKLDADGRPGDSPDKDE